MWTVHIAAPVVFALLTIGLFSRTMSVLAFLAAVSYANRASLAQFGLDDVNCMLALYLMVGPCGAAYSVDRWLSERKAGGQLPIEPSIGANIAIRLLQLNLCVEYFFSGMARPKGEPWWNGDAILMVTGMYEYQSLDITWPIHYRFWAEILAHFTVFWELSYMCVVWPRLTCRIVIALGIGMHLGIGLSGQCGPSAWPCALPIFRLCRRGSCGGLSTAAWPANRQSRARGAQSTIRQLLTVIAAKAPMRRVKPRAKLLSPRVGNDPTFFGQQ